MFLILVFLSRGYTGNNLSTSEVNKGLFPRITDPPKYPERILFCGWRRDIDDMIMVPTSTSPISPVNLCVCVNMFVIDSQGFPELQKEFGGGEGLCGILQSLESWYNDLRSYVFHILVIQ
ncbi:hypothetical protein BC332_25534 [Capsicum chinense]|nr:hypothetical protein BC332_25534 [Capsicum chinense]